jgi:hypothetical protein
MQKWPDFGAVQEYWFDAWQRSVLVLDVLRERMATPLEKRKGRSRTSWSSRPNWCATAAHWAARNYVLVRIVPREAHHRAPLVKSNIWR